MKDKRRATTKKHLMKQIVLLRVLALYGKASKYILSDKKAENDACKRYYPNEKKFSWEVVHGLIRELLELGWIRECGEEKDAKHKTRFYGLTLEGLLNFFEYGGVSDNVSLMRKAIENYQDLHILFKHWAQLENSMGSEIYEVLKEAVEKTLNDLLASSVASILKDRYSGKFWISRNFAMNFLYVLGRRAHRLTIPKIPELYDYFDLALEQEKEELEIVEGYVSMFK